jgi:3-methyl-2-oxobutanoate hydroxymethyltransferase
MKTVREFMAAKASHEKIVMVTAYDAWSARLLADSPVDCLLVGDSVAMVVHGDRDTLGATIGLIALHTRAVARGAPDKLIIADMPFLAGRKGTAYALDCAAKLVRAGAKAVKIEGLRGHAEVIRHLVDSGIPVMGHLGLQPQSINTVGGYRVQGRDDAAAAKLKDDSVKLEAAGAFAVLLECIPAKLAGEVTKSLSVPTIGIGAGVGCDGQVLVLHDLLGFNPDFSPRFARRFADGAGLVRKGVSRYASAVRAGTFPKPKESY